MKKVILIDGNNILFRSFYATFYSGANMVNNNGLHTNALYTFTNMIYKIITEYKGEYCVVAFDKGRTFRHDKYDVYKGTRDATPEELKEQFPYSRKICDLMGLKYLEIDNYEADDIIGTYAKIIDKSDDYEGLIVSSDKDLLQLISNKNKALVLKNGKEDNLLLDEELFKNTYGIDPIKMIDLKALMGDSSDNIPGVKGIGEKTALTLLQKYKDLDGVYSNLDDISPKTREKLENDKENAYMSYDIATIYRDIEVDDIESLKINEFKPELRDLFLELGFNSFITKFNLDKKEEVKTNEVKVIKDLKDLKLEDEYSIYLEVIGYNYHKAIPFGIMFTDTKHNYLVELETLRDSDILCDNKKKYTYDLKKLLVVFDKYDIKIDNNIDDLMIEAYLLNKNVKNDIAILANNYGYEIINYEKIFGTELTIDKTKYPKTLAISTMALKTKFILDYKDFFIKELDKENMLKLYKEIELPLVYVLAKMEITGFKVDENVLLNIGEDFNNELIELEKDIYNHAGMEFNINSPKQLGDILFNKIGLPYPKKVKDGKFSTDKEILDKLSSFEIVNKILRYRALSKIIGTYIEGIRNEIIDSRIHTIYNQTLTKTGRLSSERPNLQNIPIRTEEGRLIRKAFIPDHDSIIISSDYSQIELRVFSSMSNTKSMIDAFNNDIDIHAQTASEIFNKNIEDVTKNDRRTAKAVNFGILYGISGFGLSEDLDISMKEAKEFIDKYLTIYPGIKEFMDNMVKECRENGYTKTLFNRKRLIPEINEKNFIVRSSAERMAMNAPIQGTAADIIKIAMINIQKRMDEHSLNSRMLVQVHDELVFTVLKDEVEIMTKIIKEEMENVIKLSVPLKVDIEFGDTWYEAK